MPEKVEVTAIRNGGKDFIEVPTQTERWIAAALDDREKYIAAGYLHLIPAIDKTLAYYGYTGNLQKVNETETSNGE